MHIHSLIHLHYRYISMKNFAGGLYLMALTTTMAVSSPVIAGGDHAHSHDNDMGAQHHDHAAEVGMSGHGSDMFLHKKDIDGYQVTFHMMKAKPGKEMGGSHDFMIKIEKDGQAMIVPMNTKVIYPNGESEVKKAMRHGDWLMAGYDLAPEGEHQMMILFKTKDGEKHKGGVYYPAR